MTDNYFLDNSDLQFRLEQLELQDVMEIKEKGYQYHREYPAAPRHYADAKDNYRLLLEVLGEICARVIAPRAAEADQEGAHFEDGQVTYTAATQEGLLALKQADLMGAMLPWEFGGLNLPESSLSDDGGNCVAGRCGSNDGLWSAGDFCRHQRIWNT